MKCKIKNNIGKLQLTYKLKAMKIEKYAKSNQEISSAIKIEKQRDLICNNKEANQSVGLQKSLQA